jgi:hypothetical protein
MAAKYRNIKAGGYDSRKEARRAWELDMMQRAGEISELRKQVKYVLIPAQREPSTVGPRGGVKPGKLLEHECAYVADFVYWRNGREIVEDCKGVRTKDYIIKRKLMLYVHGVRIYET